MAAHWARKITLEIGERGSTFAHIESTQDAAHFLLDHWRMARSPLYCAAVRYCTKAIRGEISHEAAYISFMAAIREANVALISVRRQYESGNIEYNIATALSESIFEDLKLVGRPDAWGMIPPFQGLQNGASQAEYFESHQKTSDVVLRFTD
ncbi:DUF982 domain-containing protein [Shinella sp. CPCC 101442]|uniref:DUF982 domain-containing protein n=1 Tax=Shinella sp. CPCC 101442 TaxID=2932265 RepID=UPI0021534348|nr:DUF982 domain-containing protein [Shinella sp. CPCC 101442]MCR6502039.1 DUF982 domain-containing protein [Shinella sp. CPCC 101442]